MVGLRSLKHEPLQKKKAFEVKTSVCKCHIKLRPAIPNNIIGIYVGMKINGH
jgi:hypothetical protein